MNDLQQERDNLASELATLKREWLAQEENTKYQQPLRPPLEALTGSSLIKWSLFYIVIVYISYTLGFIVGRAG